MKGFISLAVVLAIAAAATWAVRHNRDLRRRAEARDAIRARRYARMPAGHPENPAPPSPAETAENRDLYKAAGQAMSEAWARRDEQEDESWWPFTSSDKEERP